MKPSGWHVVRSDEAPMCEPLDGDAPKIAMSWGRNGFRLRLWELELVIQRREEGRP